MANDNARSIVLRYFDEVWNQRKLAAIHDLLDPTLVGHERNADDVIGLSDLDVVANTFFQNFPNARLRSSTQWPKRMWLLSIYALSPGITTAVVQLKSLG